VSFYRSSFREFLAGLEHLEKKVFWRSGIGMPYFLARWTLYSWISLKSYMKIDWHFVHDWELDIMKETFMGIELVRVDILACGLENVSRLVESSFI
jgi:hypothetical protein